MIHGGARERISALVKSNNISSQCNSVNNLKFGIFLNIISKQICQTISSVLWLNGYIIIFLKSFLNATF